MILNVMNGLEVFDKALKQIQNPPKGLMIEGWQSFNERLGGLRPHELTIFCGATGSGKTQFLANMATNLMQKGEKLFVASVETGPTDFAVRMISVMVGRDLNTGDPSDIKSFSKKIAPDFDRIQDNVFFSTQEDRIDVMDMIETLKYMNEVQGVRVAVLDNLNFFLRITKSSDTNIAYDEAIHSFVIAAKKLPMHIFLVMHPKKTVEGKITSEFDIKGSSTAVQEAPNVLLMNRLDKKEIEEGKGTQLSREFVFKKIRKRGYYVNQPFIMEYEGAKYVEHRVEIKVSKTTSSSKYPNGGRLDSLYAD
jgi:twinkle protein